VCNKTCNFSTSKFNYYTTVEAADSTSDSICLMPFSCGINHVMVFEAHLRLEQALLSGHKNPSWMNNECLVHFRRNGFYLFYVFSIMRNRAKQNFEVSFSAG